MNFATDICDALIVMLRKSVELGNDFEDNGLYGLADACRFIAYTILAATCYVAYRWE